MNIIYCVRHKKAPRKVAKYEITYEDLLMKTSGKQYACDRHVGDLVIGMLYRSMKVEVTRLPPPMRSKENVTRFIL